jgi:hypothetical protein
MKLLKFPRGAGYVFIAEDAIVALEASGPRETQIFTTGHQFVVSMMLEEALKVIAPKLTWAASDE